MGNAWRVGDLIEVSDVDPVVRGEEIRRILSTLSTAGVPDDASGESTDLWAPFVAGYRINTSHTRSVVDTLLSGLRHADTGNAFLVNGVYGSGKTHLLGLLACLLAAPDAADVFTVDAALLEAARELKPAQRLVVFISLEEFSGKDFDLETVWWRATAERLRDRDAGRLLSDNKVRVSRADRMAILAETLSTEGYSGVVWLVDELSMFLGSKCPADLQNDASFLQFIGQRTKSSPCWVVASLQRTLESIGGIDPYSLAQIRDRYHSGLTLTLAHLPDLVQQRLLPRKDAEVTTAVMQSAYAAISDRFPRVDFGVQDLQAAFPFHPATIECLGSIASRFFSRTRTAIRFAIEEGRRLIDSQFADGSLPPLITPDRLFDYFISEIRTQPELAEYVTDVLPYFECNMDDILPDEAEHALRAVKALIAMKLAGIHPTVMDMAHTLLIDSGLPPGGNYGFMQGILDRLRSHGDYVVVRRSNDDFRDQYTIDVGSKLQQSLNRMLANTMHGFTATDLRVVSTAVEACDQEAFPLARIAGRARTERSEWLHLRRDVLVTFTNLVDLTPAQVVNAAAMLAHEQTAEDAALYVGVFTDVAAQQRHWYELTTELRGQAFGAGVAALLPQAPDEHGVTGLREYAALKMLRDTPSLRDNKRGRAICQRVDEELPLRRREAAEIVHGLYAAGSFLTSDGETVPVADARRRNPSWRQMLERCVETVLPRLFPRAPACQPRESRILEQHAPAAARLVLRGERLPASDPGLERFLYACGQPLGIAADSAEPGQWTLAGPVKEAILAEVGAAGNGSVCTMSSLTGKLHKSELGLLLEQLEVPIALLIADGDIIPLDADCLALTPSRIELPIVDHVYALRVGVAAPPEDAARLAACAAHFGLTVDTGVATTREQTHLWHELVKSLDRVRNETELASVRLLQIEKNLRQTPSQWQRAHHTIELVSRLAQISTADLLAGEAISQWLSRVEAVLASYDSDAYAQQCLADWQSLCGFLLDHGNEAILMHGYLRHPDLRLAGNDSLRPTADAIFAALASGEQLRDRWDAVRQQWRELQTSYKDRYLTWHGDVHSVSRYAAWETLLVSPTAVALDAICHLRFQPFPAAHDWESRVREVLRRRCDHPGIAQQLESFPTCTRCGLRLGEEPELPAPAVMEQSGKEILLMCLQEIRRSAAGATIRGTLSAIAPDATRARVHRLMEEDNLPPDTVAELLTPDVVAALNRVFHHPTRVRREFADLKARVHGRTLTVRAAEAACREWLHGSGELHPDDLIHIE